MERAAVKRVKHVAPHLLVITTTAQRESRLSLSGLVSHRSLAIYMAMTLMAARASRSLADRVLRGEGTDVMNAPTERRSKR